MRGPGFYNKDFLVIKSDNDLIAESITRILMTTPGERVGRPNFGSGLRALLFESMDDIFVDDVKRIISTAVNNYEPRVNLTDIQVNAVENTLTARLIFETVGNPLDENILEFSFELEDSEGV